jgi:hypothetical protein
MAKLPDERRAAFTAAYRFYEEHWDMPDTVGAWESCARDAATVAAEHGNTPLISELIMACYQAIDRENAVARRMINA